MSLSLKLGCINIPIRVPGLSQLDNVVSSMSASSEDSRSNNDRFGGIRGASVGAIQPSAPTITTNGDYTSPQTNVSAAPQINMSSSDLQASVNTMESMEADQQIDLNTAFINFYDMMKAENDRINELSKQNTEDARLYSEYVYKNQAKWYVDGLKKAGINPLMIAHGLSPTPFTSMGSAQVFSPNTPTTEYANTVNTQINSLVSLLQHAERLNFDERVAYLQHALGLKEVEAKYYATNIGALTSIFGSMMSTVGSLGSGAMRAFA